MNIFESCPQAVVSENLYEERNKVVVLPSKLPATFDILTLKFIADHEKKSANFANELNVN